MPANAPYPWETPAQALARMQQQQGGGAGGINVPQLPGAGPMQAPPQPPPQQPPVLPGVMGGFPGGGKLPDSTLPPETGQQPAAPGNRLNIPDAALGAMLGTYGDQIELSEMDRQLAQAEALRDQGQPEGRQAGRVFVAANPLEFLGTGIEKYRSGKKAQRLEEGTLKGASGGALTEDERSTLAAMGEFSGEELGRKGLRKRIGGMVKEFGKRSLED